MMVDWPLKSIWTTTNCHTDRNFKNVAQSFYHIHPQNTIKQPKFVAINTKIFFFIYSSIFHVFPYLLLGKVVQEDRYQLFEIYCFDKVF